MTEAPAVAAMAARAFGLDPGLLGSLGGCSGSAWGLGSHVLRVGRPAVIAAEEAASRAAAAVVPVPRILDRADLGSSSALLLERLPGRPAVELARLRPDLAASAGRACGAVHARLARVRAPAGLRAAPGAPASPDPRLLHLDLHPLNVLVGDQGELTGVLDWANAAAGDSELDRARTWSILALDPAARARRADPGWTALARGWTQAANLRGLSPSARAWACRFMLADLVRRYPAGQLRHVRDALETLTAAAARGGALPVSRRAGSL